MCIIERNKSKQKKAKWGKHWGKHFQHSGAFIHTKIHFEKTQTIDNKAMQSKTIKIKEARVVPAGSQNSE